MNPTTILPNPELAFQSLSNILKHVEEPKKKNQRISKRKQILQSIVVQPRDSDLNPIGEPIDCLSRDVSVSGIGFFSLGQIATSCVSIQFIAIEAGICETVFAEIIHQSQRGPLIVIGTKILVNWDV